MKNKLKVIRILKGITQEQLADMCEIGQTTISGIERDAHAPSLEVALRISRVLQVKVEDIFFVEWNAANG